jgi:hypothetical protein
VPGAGCCEGADGQQREVEQGRLAVFYGAHVWTSACGVCGWSKAENCNLFAERFAGALR